VRVRGEAGGFPLVLAGIRGLPAGLAGLPAARAGPAGTRAVALAVPVHGFFGAAAAVGRALAAAAARAFVPSLARAPPRRAQCRAGA
jgi:hypothetical protein